MECPNCQARVSKDWAHCPKCGADLEEGHYSSSDDPIDKLTKRVNKIDEFLTDQFPDEGEGEQTDEPPNEPTRHARKRAAAAKKRKTLFGD